MKKFYLSLLLVVSIIILTAWHCAAAQILFYFSPKWQSQEPQVKALAAALSQGSGLSMEPRLINSYNKIMDDFSGTQPILLYAGSFAQATLYNRGLSVPIVQGVDGQEFYSGVLIAPPEAGNDPVALVTACGPAIAYNIGTSAGESAAKTASAGKANIGVTSHLLAIQAVAEGKAKCAFTKNWVWEANRRKFPRLQALNYPGVSEYKHPNNILSANKAMSPEAIGKIKVAVKRLAEAFGVKSFQDVEPAIFKPSIDLMIKGNIDPKTYRW